MPERFKAVALGFTMYATENEDQVPEEGNTIVPINNGQNADAWYNLVALIVDQPTLVSLRTSNPPKPPLPGDKTLFACPSATRPSFAAIAALQPGSGRYLDLNRRHFGLIA